jgi:hypothetical protein
LPLLPSIDFGALQIPRVIPRTGAIISSQLTSVYTEIFWVTLLIRVIIQKVSG